MRIHPQIRHAPDPDHPGWSTWDLPGDGRFASTVGKLLVRAEAPARARVRMFPGEAHTNLSGAMHGGAVMTFIDMAFFAGGALAGADVAFAVTLDCETRFLAPGKPGTPLDAEVEILRETGRLVFLRGLLVQDGAAIASFSGTLRKAKG
ncbi:PaaI family thioesterase [Sphingomonas parva]|uniref:PaaI family thioesterase n=1 Tax=Sphingomonas parva TaxID=2555898 RepID=A0A4Y8ZUN5_9SPHN|nr:PaaI family thioesterase [Sphingomonas parva]TFI58855.1 PaaI family thioesterase [Sphingomonas parva]